MKIDLTEYTFGQVLGYEIEELIECESCGEEVPEDYIEYFYEERICHSCLDDGYGG